MKINDYFPTRIFTHNLDAERAAEYNPALLKLIRDDRAGDPAGLPRSSYAQLGGWHSQTNLHKNPSYADILAFIHTCADFVSQSSGYSERYALKVSTMWSIINPPGGANMSHVHPGCLWSGVYYIQAPENAGNISFTDPRTANVMIAPVFAENGARPRHTKTKINITPEAGKIVIFPSWLYHGVAPNMSDKSGSEAERVIISFNFNQKRIAN